MGKTGILGWMLFWWVMIVSALSVGAGDVPPYAVAKLPTPVFSDPSFPKLFGGGDGRTLVRDRCGRIPALEFIAPAGSVFAVLGNVPGGPVPLWRVSTAEYPYPSKEGYFVDLRGLTPWPTKPPERERRLPPRGEILQRLLAAAGTPYVWGGNIRAGLPDLLSLYPPSSPLSPAAERAWTLAGLDCSGLLYEATNGVTPRNTSALIGHGGTVPVAGLDAGGIARVARPLDLIVWSGHVMIVIDGGQVIESRLKCGVTDAGGVVVRQLSAALAEVMATRTPVNDYRERLPDGRKTFVVRRWYTE